MGIVQARESLKGNKPLAWDNPDLVLQGMAYMPAGIMLDVWMKYGGLELLRNMSDPNHEVTSSTAQSDLPPLLGDIGKIMEYGGGALGLWGDPKKHARYVRKLVVAGTDLAPFKSLWYARAAYRALVQDTLAELIDPRGYRRALRMLLNKTEGRADRFFNQAQPGTTRNALGEFLDRLNR